MWKLKTYRSIFLLLEHPDVGKVTGQAVEVETETDYKFLGNFEAYIVGLHGMFEGFRLEQQSRDLERSRLSGRKVIDQIAYRVAGVDYVFNDNHVAPLDVVGKVHNLAHNACRRRPLI